MVLPLTDLCNVQINAKNEFTIPVAPNEAGNKPAIVSACWSNKGTVPLVKHKSSADYVVQKELLAL
jgi:hypothetical protein